MYRRKWSVDESFPQRSVHRPLLSSQRPGKRVIRFGDGTELFRIVRVKVVCEEWQKDP